ncbi:hypothetical protein D0469_05840 [Peribacillus saganii]|uniref:YxlC family protein n=1 Tax=Peribacillus saganii TaxID=2303992 RepID=A0A372LSX4_9BACI|nr:YxlC family protein [Peribacillus saganii]RFU70654.1 hypothetical protein D0469_05840 [Peribacillus saganii]
MKKIVNIEEAQNKEFKSTIVKIKLGLGHLDENSKVFNPDLSMIQAKIAEQRELAERKWRRDIKLFCLIAAVILSVMLIALYQNPIVFAAVQGISAACFIAVTFFKYIKQKVKET